MYNSGRSRLFAGEDGRSAVLYNKYALEKEGIFPDDIPSVHDVSRGRSNNPGPDSISNYRLNDPDIDVEEERHRDARMREPEILVTRAPRSAPGSLRGPPRPGKLIYKTIKIL
ncbi:hypothetical protein Anas_11963 [Armadillidium nasatum]|uniref:Uncharacterized protein n=1 Tax=Armadillidium nasatum TaxID=96803 RepID=A0A5N5T7A8_9CRUS|nr:hypothetical protein Anas_11963 [Armadillidium nasatum]